MAENESTLSPDHRNHPLVALWRELLELGAAYEAPARSTHTPTTTGRSGPGCAKSRPRSTARPDNLVGLCVQVRYLQRWLDIGSHEDQIVLAGSIAAALARLGGVEVAADPDIRGDRS